jgi:hypothetical protein
VNIWQVSLLIGALLTLCYSTQVTRAWLWIGIGTLSFVASTMWARAELPSPPFFIMLCDTAVCLTIYTFATRQWEIWLFRIFQGSVLLSIFHVFGGVQSQYFYVAFLEAFNWAALLLIAGTATIQMVGAGNGNHFGRRWSGRVRGAYGTFFTPRKSPPFHKA